MEILTYHGKPVDKMTYHQLRKELMVQRWFANRMARYADTIEIGQYYRRKRAEQKHKPEEFERLYAEGKIDRKEYGYRKANYNRAIAFWKNSFDYVEFIRMQEQNARDVVAACEDALRVKPEVPRRTKPRYSPMRRYTDERKRKYKRKLDKARNKWVSNYRSMMQWQRAIENKGLGELWNREKFIAVCNDRGHYADISIYKVVSEALKVSYEQVKVLLKTGAFTWGQVLALGSRLYMSPKEFVDTFMSGYFVEISDGVFEADGKYAEEMPERPCEKERRGKKK